MNKKPYCAPSLQIQQISIGEFCAGVCANRRLNSTPGSGGNGTWAGTIRNINEAGYRTLRVIEGEDAGDYIVLSY